MRHLLPTIFLILISSLTWAADPVLLPADVQAVLTDYDAKVAKAKADVVAKLQKAQEAATKKGNLDLAMALKAKVAEFGGSEATGNGPLADAAKLTHAVPRMTQKDWESIPGEPITVKAVKSATDTGITLTASDSYVLVPCPVDQWTVGPADKYTKVRWDSGEMHLCWKVGNAEQVSTADKDGLVVHGEGALTLMGSDANCGDNWGFVRVKVVKAAR